MNAKLAHFSDATLHELGAEAGQLLATGNLRALHERFGYALAFDRPALQALESDVAEVLSEVKAAGFGTASSCKVSVQHLEPNDAGIVSLVQCVVQTKNDNQVLLELVLTANGTEGHLTLEQVSVAP